MAAMTPVWPRQGYDALADDAPGPEISSGKHASESGVVPNIGICKLVAITFFAVAGGPYGVEPLVQAGGAKMAVLGLLLAPWLWGLPMALMTAELSTAIPESGGYIVWVHRAFGEFWTVQMSVWSIVNALLDNAMYPIIFADYVTQFSQNDFDSGSFANGSSLITGGSSSGGGDEEPPITLRRWCLGMSMVVPIFFLNLKGVDLAGDFALLFALLVLAPFAVLVVWGAPELSTDKLLAPPDPSTLDWGAYVTVLLWNECGFDSAGTIAAEVANPAEVYVPAMLLSMLLVTLCYLLPVMVGVCTMVDPALWVDGYWTSVGYEISGGWMAGWITFAGAVSCAGQLNTNFATNSQAMAAMGETGVMPGETRYR